MTMRYGYDENGEKVEATEGCTAYDAPPSDPDRVILTARPGKVRVPHFAYPPGCPRNDGWHKLMSLFHTHWQDLFDEEHREFLFKAMDGTLHRADIFTEDKKVLEIQNSYILIKEIEQRQDFYYFESEEVASMQWIFNAKEFGNIRYTSGVTRFKPNKAASHAGGYFNIPGTRYLFRHDSIWEFYVLETNGKTYSTRPLDGVHNYIANRCLFFVLEGREPSEPVSGGSELFREELKTSALRYHLYPDFSKVVEDVFAQAKQECELIKLFLDAEEKRDFGFLSRLSEPLQYPDSYYRYRERIQELEAAIEENPSLNNPPPTNIPF